MTHSTGGGPIAGDVNHLTIWQEWLQRPQSLWVHRIAFNVHFAIGVVVCLYVMLMGITGSVIVYRDELSRRLSVEWLVRLHTNLLSRQIGRFLNGIGAIALTLLCLTGAIIWWPGIKNWHRSLTVNWRAHLGRVSWDLHSALGFWFYLFVLIWGISGMYFAFSRPFYALFGFLDPHDRLTDPVLSLLSDLHFGRFNWFTKVLWSLGGLVPAVLAGTGVFVCCRRWIYNKTSNPHQETGVIVARAHSTRQQKNE